MQQFAASAVGATGAGFRLTLQKCSEGSVE